MNISLIVAMDRNRVIGNKNQLPWHLPADLKHFKELTMGKPIIMGRKTFESIGKPLPGRRNLIVSTQQDYQVNGCEVFSSLVSAIEAAQKDQHEIMIIGGATIFAQALPLASRLYLTIIDHEFTGDTFFPVWVKTEWQEIKREQHAPDEKNVYRYSFVDLKRV